MAVPSSIVKDKCIYICSASVSDNNLTMLTIAPLLLGYIPIYSGQLHNCLFLCFRVFDLVNLHLFHDASNLVSSDCSPSVYSSNRRRALTHVLTR